MEDSTDIIELEDWETVQSNIDSHYFSFNPTDQEEQQIETENSNSVSIDPYKEPHQLKKNPSSIISNSSEGNEGKGGKWNNFDWRGFSIKLAKYLGGFGKIKPIWCVSAVVLGLVVLKNRVFKMKRKERRVPLITSTNNKKEMQFVSNALRLNEALSAVRCVPVIKIPNPNGTASPWTIVPVR